MLEIHANHWQRGGYICVILAKPETFRGRKMTMKFSNRSKLVASVSMGVIGAMMMADMASAQAVQQQPETVIVTGSSIKRKVLDNALPMQIITKEDIEREGISSAEQLSMFLTASSTGADNLASNADVVNGAQRGMNGVSAANLRGQGAGGTLVLFNGRRIAANGLSGSVVDLNQIPFAALERVDVLKDGASAIYGTDAIGGVINYITKKNYQGLNAQAFADVTEAGGGEIFRYSLTGGYGDINEQNFNIMASASYSDNKVLNGRDRDWMNGYQPNRGLSIDTTGAPFATIFPINAVPGTIGSGGTLFGGTTGAVLAPFLPGSTTVRATGGVNVLDLPGGPGCKSVDGMEAFDELIWSRPSAAFACQYDTGRAVVIQQPIERKNFVTRGIYRIGKHELSAEVMLSESVAAKRFSEPQYSSSGTLLSATGTNTNSNSWFFYPLNSTTQSTYDSVYNALRAVFPTLGAAAGTTQPVGSRYGLPIGFRWRCLPCGQREITTTSKTGRYFVGADGPLGAGWEYSAGASYAWSEASSLLGSGYYYRNTNPPVHPSPRGITLPGAASIGKVGIDTILNSGIINVFLPPGQQQSAAALAALESASAKGVTLYGGKFEVSSIDGSASGPLFELPGGTAYAAVGFNLREEKYGFGAYGVTLQPEIFLAPGDAQNAVGTKSRTVNALFFEIALPLIKDMELTLAARRDEYSGFGATTNPKISLKYRPFEQILFRGSYNTGFRVPSFNQIFNGVAQSPLAAGSVVDPVTCPTLAPSTTIVGCAGLNVDSISGGNLELEPEKAEQYSAGFVYEPTRNYSVSIDWWHIEKTNSIVNFLSDFGVTRMSQNYNLFADRFLRNSAGTLVAIDGRFGNAGGSVTEGIELGLRGKHALWGGTLSGSMEGSYISLKKSRVLDNAPYGASEIGSFSLAGDLGLRWKHNINFNYRKGDWTSSVSQVFRAGYTNFQLLGIRNGTVTPPDLVKETDDYIIYNANVTYRGFKNIVLNAGVKNLLDTDPPFAITYDTNLGSGGGWEPRVADPRGRAFTLSLEYKF